MTLALEIAVWSALAVILATYVAYPLSLVVLAAFRRRHAPPRPALFLTAGERQGERGDCKPSVTLIISAFNEAAVIRDKLSNALCLDYPRDKLEVVVVSDGSSDGTDEIVESFSDRGIKLFRLSGRRGKSHGITQCVPSTAGEVLVFSDANSIYRPDALTLLVGHFSDPKVGYVVGCQQYYGGDHSAVSVSERLYWAYESFVKDHESRLSSVVGGDGAIYALRKELFEPLRDDDISDFVTPLQVVAKGYRGVYERQAVCYESTAATFAGEFRRKIRIVNRSLRAVFRVPRTLNPFAVGWFSYQLVFHKLLRWLVPFFLLALFIAAAALVQRHVVYTATFAAQAALYAIACCRLIPGVRRLKPVYLAYYFCMVNAAAAVGTITALFGKRFQTWQPERLEHEQAAAPVSQ